MSAESLPMDRCHDAIVKIERDAVGVAEGTWRFEIRDELWALRQALAQPDRSLGDADLSELGFDAPRLTHALRRLRVEREWLTDRLDALLADGPEVPALTWGHAIQDVLIRVRAYRRHVARILHEAYVVDIGGET